MSRPAVEVADLLREQGDRFIGQNSWLNYQQLTVLRAITRCRTAALGGHLDQCLKCGHQAISYNSCRNRHCPKCQSQARQRWIEARGKELPEVPYFHVVFTLPQELNALCPGNARILYDLLFQCSAAAMLEIAANPKHLGARIGFISVLHTWGQNLLLHPHVHCIVPSGGLSPDHKRWLRPKYAFFLPVTALSLVFRARFVAGLRKTYRQHKLVFAGQTADLRNPKRFNAFVDSLFRQKWVVYAKQAFGGPTQVLRYLGRYAHGNKQRKMTLRATEFLRRLVQHILPRGFVRIRQFGYLANNRRAELLSLVRQFLAAGILQSTVCPSQTTDHSVWRCPECNGEMQIGPNLSAIQLASRCKLLDSS